MDIFVLHLNWGELSVFFSNTFDEATCYFGMVKLDLNSV